MRYCQNIELQFAYNKKIQNEKNFYKVILDTQNILNLWWMRSLTIEGKITIFKTLTLSKVVYLTLLAVVPNHIIDELIKVQTNFIQKNTLAKIKHKILILDHKQGGLKCADVTFKITSLQCSWLKQLLDDTFHEWKVIPLFYIKKAFGNNFKFYSNLDYKLRNKVLLKKCYKEILPRWMIYFFSQEFRNIHRKTPFLESLFNKYFIESLLLKRDPQQVFSCKYHEILKNTYSEEHLRTTTSKSIV